VSYTSIVTMLSYLILMFRQMYPIYVNFIAFDMMFINNYFNLFWQFLIIGYCWFEKLVITYFSSTFSALIFNDINSNTSVTNYCISKVENDSLSFMFRSWLIYTKSKISSVSWIENYWLFYAKFMNCNTLLSSSLA